MPSHHEEPPGDLSTEYRSFHQSHGRFLCHALCCATLFQDSIKQQNKDLKLHYPWLTAQCSAIVPEHPRSGNPTGKPSTMAASPAWRRALQIAESLPACPKGSRFDRTVPEKITGSCSQQTPDCLRADPSKSGITSRAVENEGPKPRSGVLRTFAIKIKETKVGLS